MPARCSRPTRCRCAAHDADGWVLEARFRDPQRSSDELADARRAQALHRSLIDHGPAVTYVHLRDGTPLHMSPQIERITGIPVGDWLSGQAHMERHPAPGRPAGRRRPATASSWTAATPTAARTASSTATAPCTGSTTRPSSLHGENGAAGRDPGRGDRRHRVEGGRARAALVGAPAARDGRGAAADRRVHRHGRPDHRRQPGVRAGHRLAAGGGRRADVGRRLRAARTTPGSTTGSRRRSPPAGRSRTWTRRCCCATARGG